MITQRSLLNKEQNTYIRLINSPIGPYLDMDNETVPPVLTKLAGQLGTVIKRSRLDIPPAFGNGYCKGFILNENIRILISDYELNEDIPVENPEINKPRKTIFFKFQNVFKQATNTAASIPSVLIATSRIDTDSIISIHTNRATINIEVDADYLNSLFNQADRSPFLESLLQNSRPLLFEQVIYPSLQKIIDEIVNEPVEEPFMIFFLRVKAEELICRLLIELEKRAEKHFYALNAHDIATVYKVKEYILTNMAAPPVINHLSTTFGISPTKLKRLFKQIFGDSIFSYFQDFRMRKAARLLVNENLSVTEVGYTLGFTNLSHFARVFNEHFGMKPKQYAMVHINSAR